MSSNAEQIEYWNGPGAKRWTRYRQELEYSLKPFGAKAIERAAIAEGERILDVGCGCGDTTLDLASSVGSSGFVEGVDVSGPMLEVARTRAASIPNIHFLQADASTHAFDDKFALIFSRFGVMFFEDPVAAFAHLHQALTTDGRVVFACWRSFAENPWASVPLGVVQSLLWDAPDILQDNTIGPFAFAERDRIFQILSDSGYSDIQIERFDQDLAFSSTGLESAVEFALNTGPAARLLLDATPEARERVREHMTDTLAQHATGDHVALPASSWIVSARA